MKDDKLRKKEARNNDVIKQMIHKGDACICIGTDDSFNTKTSLFIKANGQMVNRSVYVESPGIILEGWSVNDLKLNRIPRRADSLPIEENGQEPKRDGTKSNPNMNQLQQGNGEAPREGDDNLSKENTSLRKNNARMKLPLQKTILSVPKLGGSDNIHKVTSPSLGMDTLSEPNNKKNKLEA